MFESACIQLDLRTCTILTGSGAGVSYQKYAEALTEQTSPKEELQAEKNVVSGFEQIVLVVSLLSSQTPESSPAYQHLITTLAESKARVQQLES